MTDEQACEMAVADVMHRSGALLKTDGVDKKVGGGGLATASLVLAIASWPLTLCCAIGVVTALVAIVVGHVAIRKARHGGNSTGVRSRAVVALIVSYVYIGIVVLLVAKIIGNRVSRTAFADGTGMSFAMHIPLKGTSYEWRIKDKGTLWIAMAPEEVRLSTLFNVASPVVPENLRDFEFLTISFFRPRSGGTVNDVARDQIEGTQVWDKTYEATDPQLITISDIPSVFFRESIIINETRVRGIVFLVPSNDWYYVLTFRSDPSTYNESFYRRIAGTFRPERTANQTRM